MAHTPVTLSQALAAFTDIYSPRIVGRVNDYDVRIAAPGSSSAPDARTRP
jgi:hypothetical protein